ncbi:peptidoglycan hydrolase RipC [Mycobacterium sp.]|uniref:peptidoglycan hydrolase RipC n=1 Tax=Mycobacterium sp. TaxID=1785 RepID=UPI0025ED244F|nr:peptidoglycan hydrolase RipC [Mycobacterium sp.]
MAVAALAGFVALSGVAASGVLADPANDATAKLSELSRQAEQTTEAMHSAQLDLNNKLAAQRAADKKHADAVAAADAAKTRLATFQAGVDKFAAAMYMGGRTDGMNAIMTAESPQQLIGKLAVSRVISTAMLAQMATYRATREEAAKAESESAKSAADAKTAAEQAASVRADLQSKQSRLQLQIGIVKSQYLALNPHERTALAAPGPPPPAAPPAPDALPPGGGQPGGPGAGPGSGQGAIAVQAALTRVGDPYSWGGAAPGGFDCSGLVMWAFQQAGIALPHSSQAMAHGGQPVSLSDLQPGDVLTFYSDASHAGLYIGDGMMIHSSTYGVPVRVVPMNSSGPIYDARRY